jgi:hypothetical protein
MQHQWRNKPKTEQLFSAHHEVKWLSATNGEGCTITSMIVTGEVGTTQLADLIKQVQAGDEVLLTQVSASAG